MATRLMRWESSQKWRYISPIDWAAAKGQVDVVKELLRIDPNLFRKLTSRKRNKKLETMWDESSCVEARKGRALVARELLREDAYTIDVHGGWALFLAVAAADVTMVETLLAMKPELASGQGDYKSVDLLTAAAQAGNLYILRLLMQHHTESRKSKEDMASTLHAAALGGAVDILRDVLEVGGEHIESLILATNSHGATAMDAAASAGHIEVVNELLCIQPEMLYHRDNIGNTALHTAAQRGHVHVVEGLLEADSLLILVTNDRGDTALHVAVYGPFHPPGEKGTQRALSVVKCLLAAKPDLVNSRNTDGRTALHFAVGFAYSYSAEIVKTLLAAPGIDACAMDNEGMTALDVARASLVSEDVIEHLRSAGVSSGDLKIKDVKSVLGGEENQSSQVQNVVRPPTRMGRPLRLSGSFVGSKEDRGQSEKPGPPELTTMQTLFRVPNGQDMNAFQLPTELEASIGLPERSRPPSRMHSRNLSISGLTKLESQNNVLYRQPLLHSGSQVPTNPRPQELSPSISVITNPLTEVNIVRTGEDPLEDGGMEEQPGNHPVMSNHPALLKSFSLTDTGAPPVSRRTARVRQTSKLPLPPSGGTSPQNFRDDYDLQMEPSVGKSYPLFLYEDKTDKKMETVVQMRPSAPSTPSSRQSAKMFLDSASKSEHPQVETLVGSSPSFHYAAEVQLDNFNKEMHRQRVDNAINTMVVLASVIAIIAFVGVMAPLPDIKFPGRQDVASDAVDTVHISLYYIYYFSDTLAFLTALFVILLLATVMPTHGKAAESLLSKANKLVWAAAIFTVVAFLSAVNISAGKHHQALAWAISAIGVLVLGVHFLMMLYMLTKFRKNFRSDKQEVRLYQMVAGKEREKHHASPLHQLNRKMKEWPEQSTGGETSSTGQQYV